LGSFKLKFNNVFFKIYDVVATWVIVCVLDIIYLLGSFKLKFGNVFFKIYIVVATWIILEIISLIFTVLEIV